MNTFFESNPGFRSRIAHHIEFPDYSTPELLDIGSAMLDQLNYYFTKSAKNAFTEYINLRKEQPHFANARSIRNALDRARLRQANRLFKENQGLVDAEKLSTLEEADIRESRVFSGGIDN